MFERTRGLILRDRNAAREALLKEMAEDERRSVEAELDAIEREEADRIKREKARAREVEALADARKKNSRMPEIASTSGPIHSTRHCRMPAKHLRRLRNFGWKSRGSKSSQVTAAARDQ